MIKVDIVNEVSRVADITKVKAEVAVDAVFDHHLVQGVAARPEHPAGIDQGEMVPLPFRGLRDGVPGGPGDRGDDRPPGARNPVEQCGLSHVGTAHQHDIWAGFHGHVEILFSTDIDSVSASILYYLGLLRSA